MGSRGPSKTPSNIVTILGNPGKRARNKREPKPPAGMISPPSLLDEYGCEEWEQVYPMLDRLGLVTEADRITLAGYCDSVSKLRHANEEIEKKGRYLTTPQGEKRAPWSLEAEVAKREILQHSRLFGFTPADRAGIEAPGTGEEDDFAKDMA